MGITFVNSHLRPYANLLVYGYSTGGFNALNLCRRLGWAPVPVQVKLLITVDACLKRDGRLEDPGAKPNNVQTHINFYQQEIEEEYRGRIVPGAVNTLMVARHDTICRATVPEVCGMVANALGG